MQREFDTERDALRRKIARLAGRTAANRRIAQPGYDGREATRAATEARWAKLDREVDPALQLSPDARRAKAKRLWQARMAEAKLRKAQGRLKRTPKARI